jgi:outer membrane immunogenic protein
MFFLSKTRPRLHRQVRAASLTLVTLMLVGGSKIAAAADMAKSGMPTKAPAAPAYQWTGCYVGLNGGGGAIGTNFQTTVNPGTYLVPADAAVVSNDGTGSHDNSNFIGGGQVGCNWQSGTVVAGLEGDFDYFPGNSSFANNTDTLPSSGMGTPFVVGQQLTTNYLATVRPRIGIAADRNFAYLTGGVAFTRASYTESYADSNGAIGTAAASSFLTGWTAGAGWEYALTDHWLFRVEYLFAAFPSTSAVGSIALGDATNSLHGSAGLVMQVARAALNFKF